MSQPIGTIRKSLAERFWSKVVKTPGCWIWTGSVVKSGRGQLVASGLLRGRAKGNVLATHVSWFLHFGVWPKLHVLHRCHVPACVRPLHLYEGTEGDNRRDDTVRGSRGWTPTHCRHGHDQSIRPRGGKLVDKYGRRVCYQCNSDGRRERKAAERA